MAFRWTGAPVARQGRRMFAVLALIFGWWTSAPADAATAIRSVVVDGGRIVVQFDGPVLDATGLVLTGSRQIAVDIAQAMPGMRTVAGGLVRRVRQVRQGDGTRLVFDLAQPAEIGRASCRERVSYHV